MGATQLAFEDARALRDTMRLLACVVGFGVLVWLAGVAAALAWATPHAWQLLASM